MTIRGSWPIEATWATGGSHSAPRCGERSLEAGSCLPVALPKCHISDNNTVLRVRKHMYQRGKRLSSWNRPLQERTWRMTRMALLYTT